MKSTIFLSLGFAMFMASTSPVAAQQWTRVAKPDAFSGVTYSTYSLQGTFLEGPASGTRPIPEIALRCEVGRHTIGFTYYVNGKIASASLNIGANVGEPGFKGRGTYRIDDSKPHLTEDWFVTSDSKGIALTARTIDDFIFGNKGIHTPESKYATKLVIALEESKAGRIVLQFDLPDATQLADECGLVARHK